MAPTPDLSRADMRASFAKLKALVGELDERHIIILAGTDGVGFELIRELELYVEAGMTPERGARHGDDQSGEWSTAWRTRPARSRKASSRNSR